MDTFDRYEVLHTAVREKNTFPTKEIMDISARVAFPPLGSDSPENAPHRTLWYTLYDTQERSLAVKFYLGEKSDPRGGGRIQVEYSDFVELKLARD